MTEFVRRQSCATLEVSMQMALIAESDAQGDLAGTLAASEQRLCRFNPTLDEIRMRRKSILLAKQANERHWMQVGELSEFFQAKAMARVLIQNRAHSGYIGAEPCATFCVS